MNLAHTLSRKSRWIWMGGVALVVAAAGVAWFVQQSPRGDVLELRDAPLLRTLQFSARVATLSRVDVGSTVTGRVAQVRVAEGSQVRQGEVLIQLETEELRAAVTQAQASERQAQARLAGLRSTGRTATQAGLAQADSTLKAAEAELARTQQLVKQGFLSEARLDEVRRAVEVARAQQAGARAQTQANAEAGTDVAQAQAQLALASAATAAARARLAQAAVLAPTDARVLTRDAEPGQIVQPGKALMRLALAGPTQLTAQVDERFLDQLQPGQKAAVVADAFADQRFAARVLSIAPAVDAQRGAIEVKFALEQQAPVFLREDMTLSVEVETGRRERALVLPLSALRTQPSPTTATVLVADAGRAQERQLRLGLRTLDAVEV
ncbi:MAG: efflux RND transporter periplasmic adaptor subunit, partial [Polaromonas sp.]|nr:efflux RND transporter periplasmic adaptor subunit [Polaromonas sp.]